MSCNIITDTIIDLNEFPEIRHFLEEKEYILNSLIESDKINYINNRYLDIKNFCGYLGQGEGGVLIAPNKLIEILGVNNTSDFDMFFKNFLEYILRNLKEEKIVYALSLFTEPVEEFKVNDSIIFKLLLLLEEKNRLINSIYLILSNPHRKLIEYEEYKGLEEVSCVDENVLVDIIQHPEFIYESQNGVIQERYSPARVLQYEVEETFDTLENRFVKHFLKEIDNVLSYDLKDFLYIPALKQIKEEIEFALQSYILSEVGELHYFPSNSQVLMKRAGYRELFQIFRLFHLSFVPQIFKNLDLAFSLKDMATLWEYYVLIEILRELREHFGPYIGGVFKEKKKGKTIYDYAEFKFEGGPVLYFQRTLYSYSSLEFRPDYLIEYNGDIFVFDAKFRPIEENEYKLYFNIKKDIFANMHYYKDGLNLNMAVAVCIGERDGGMFYCQGENNNGECECRNEKLGNRYYNVVRLTLRDALSCLEYLNGIGYIVLKPDWREA